MQLKTLAVAAYVVLVAGLPHPLLGQSLADIARQEEARRKALRDPAKVITNRDLLPPPIVSAQPPDAAKDAAAAKPSDAKEAPKEPPKDQAYWAGRAKGLQGQLDADQTLAGTLQAQLDGLTLAFLAGGDPEQRAVIEGNRQKAVADLTKAKDAIAKDQQAIADFDDETRRAAVPPGWLR